MGRNITHGKSYTKEYKIWSGMKDRCNNPNNPNYKHYGGRGITVCSEWEESFEVFLRDMGSRPREEHSLDRLNNNKGYSPENCRWATGIQQAYNRRPPVEFIKSTIVVAQRLHELVFEGLSMQKIVYALNKEGYKNRECKWYPGSVAKAMDVLNINRVRF